MKDLPILPLRIVKMIKELHERGYESLYLYAGMSPSGTHWRFTIGIIDETNLWPGQYSLIYTSLGTTSKPAWSEIDASVEKLADDFEKFYAKDLLNAKQLRPDFVQWFNRVAEKTESELLEFYADYESRHKYLLEDAPYYRQ